MGVRSRLPTNNRMGTHSPVIAETAPRNSSEYKSLVGEKRKRSRGLTFDWRSIHQFELHEVLRLVVCAGSHACCLPSNDRQLHVLDLDSDQEEVNFAQNHVLQVVLLLVEFKLDVQAVLNTDLHLDALDRCFSGGLDSALVNEGGRKEGISQSKRQFSL